MQVDLSPEIEAKLARLAASQGRTPQAIVQEIVEQFVAYDSWFIAEVEKGLASIERGDVLTHEEVGARITGSSIGLCLPSECRRPSP